MPKDTDTKPDGWKKLRRENDPEGPPEVGFDPGKRANYHVGTDPATGEPVILYHGVPEGFRFTAAGQLVVKDSEGSPVPEQVTGTPEQPASIPAAGTPEAGAGPTLPSPQEVTSG